MTRRVVERSSQLPGPPDAVWHALMSPEIAPIIDPSCKEWRPDRDPVGVGTRFLIRGRLGGVPFRATSEVATWDPPRLGVFESVRPARPLKMFATHALAPDGDGTAYRWTIEIKGPWPLVALIARLWPGAMARQERAMSDYLRKRA
jgi:hypothetical protein